MNSNTPPGTMDAQFSTVECSALESLRANHSAVHTSLV